MGSSVSPIVGNLYIEDFEHKTITTAVNPPKTWKKYVDDTYMIQLQTHKVEFLKHINSVDLSIKFTVEEIKSDTSMPFCIP